MFKGNSLLMILIWKKNQEECSLQNYSFLLIDFVFDEQFLSVKFSLCLKLGLSYAQSGFTVCHLCSIAHNKLLSPHQAKDLIDVSLCVRRLEIDDNVERGKVIRVGWRRRPTYLSSTGLRCILESHERILLQRC